jgi:hypothetical protein
MFEPKPAPPTPRKLSFSDLKEIGDWQEKRSGLPVDLAMLDEESDTAAAADPLPSSPPRNPVSPTGLLPRHGFLAPPPIIRITCQQIGQAVLAFHAAIGDHCRAQDLPETDINAFTGNLIAILAKGKEAFLNTCQVEKTRNPALAESWVFIQAYVDQHPILDELSVEPYFAHEICDRLSENRLDILRWCFEPQSDAAKEADRVRLAQLASRGIGWGPVAQLMGDLQPDQIQLGNLVLELCEYISAACPIGQEENLPLWYAGVVSALACPNPGYFSRFCHENRLVFKGFAEGLHRYVSDNITLYNLRHDVDFASNLATCLGEGRLDELSTYFERAEAEGVAGARKKEEGGSARLARDLLYDFDETTDEGLGLQKLGVF